MASNAGLSIHLSHMSASRRDRRSVSILRNYMGGFKSAKVINGHKSLVYTHAYHLPFFIISPFLVIFILTSQPILAIVILI